MTRRIHVSDHALLRYLERVGGFEIDLLREDITKRLQPYAGIGRGAIVIDGHAYVMDRSPNGNEVLVTVLPAGSHHRGITTGGNRW